LTLCSGDKWINYEKISLFANELTFQNLILREMLFDKIFIYSQWCSAEKGSVGAHPKT